MKVKIFISTFSLPLFWLANFIIIKYYHDFSLNPDAVLGFFLGSLVKLAISRRFLINLNIDDKVIAIDYYNQLIIKKSITLSLLDIQNVEYVNKNWFSNEFEKLQLKTSKNTLTFNLTTKYMKEKIKTEMLSKIPKLVKI